MQIFTFDNSLFFETKDINQKKVLKLKDNDQKYFYDIGRVIYPHDKIFKEVLDKDTSMPYRMLKYIIAIMDSCIDKSRLGKKGYKLPRVYSFVIYTGKEKWNVENNFENMREEGITLTEEAFPNFKVMDINDYTNKELLEEKNLLSKMMLLEKAQNIEELEENLKNIADRKMKEEDKIFIKRVVKYIFREKLSKEKYEEIIKKLEDKKMAEFMFLNIVQNYIDEEIKKEKKRQENEIKSELENEIKSELENKIIIEMIKNKIDEKMILKITKIDKEELKKIKKDNNLCYQN